MNILLLMSLALLMLTGELESVPHPQEVLGLLLMGAPLQFPFLMTFIT